MNETDAPQIGAVAFPPPYPGSKPNTWPPPSGGAPVTTPELGPITNPFPYGTTQPANISLANPSPVKRATAFPKGMPVNNGQNQTGGTAGQWPWPNSALSEPQKADPFFSRIPV